MSRPVMDGPDAPTAGMKHRCQGIADYLLELAREDELEPALDEIVDALDDGMRQLEGRARRSVEKVHVLLRSGRRSRLASTRMPGETDPYFWG